MTKKLKHNQSLSFFYGNPKVRVLITSEWTIACDFVANNIQRWRKNGSLLKEISTFYTFFHYLSFCAVLFNFKELTVVFSMRKKYSVFLTNLNKSFEMSAHVWFSIESRKNPNTHVSASFYVKTENQNQKPHILKLTLSI